MVQWTNYQGRLKDLTEIHIPVDKYFNEQNYSAVLINNLHSSYIQL